MTRQGTDRERVLRRENAEQTFYVGTLFERVVAGTTTVDKSYVYAAGRLVAVHQPGAQALEPTQADFQYFHQDYRRSIETVTDGQGTILRQGISYDPWGRRRNDNWTDPSIEDPPLYSDTTRKGFTGQDQLDLIGVVHLGARMYDPILGRFLSPDPFVQAPLTPRTSTATATRSTTRCATSTRAASPSRTSSRPSGSSSSSPSSRWSPTAP